MEISILTQIYHYQFSEYRQRFHSGGGQPGRGRFWVRVLSGAPPKIHGHLQISWICSRLYRSKTLQLNTRWKALAEIYKMHSFAPFLNRIPKNEENHGGEKILVQSRENRPGEAHRQLQLSTQCYPRARTRIKAV